MLCFEPVTEVSIRPHRRVKPRGKTSEGAEVDVTGQAGENTRVPTANSVGCLECAVRFLHPNSEHRSIANYVSTRGRRCKGVVDVDFWLGQTDVGRRAYTCETRRM